ncbi:MAG TPA: hypothetical protein VM580_06255 [Labilithrix sp.]|nr:hypothetical protein [Labilithrix sp.]
MKLVAVVAACALACGRGRGLERVTYPDGALHVERETSAGIPDGNAKSWRATGQLRWEGTYERGSQHGVFRYFDTRGRFAYQAYFFRGTEIWRSSQQDATPPATEIEAFAATYRWAEEDVSSTRLVGSPSFVLADRAPLRRLGAQFGFGSGGGLGLASIFRVDAFADYTFSPVGGYAHYTQSFVGAGLDSYLAGKSALDVGVTKLVPIGTMDIALRLGSVVPLANDDRMGFLGSAAGNYLRPADAIMSYASAFAMRSSASVSYGRGQLRFQGDAGFDVAAGGQSSYEPLARANFALGLNQQFFKASLEVSNTVKLSDPIYSVHAFALAVGRAYTRWSFTGAFVLSTEGHGSLLSVVGYEL